MKDACEIIEVIFKLYFLAQAMNTYSIPWSESFVMKPLSVTSLDILTVSKQSQKIPELKRITNFPNKHMIWCRTMLLLNIKLVKQVLRSANVTCSQEATPAPRLGIHGDLCMCSTCTCGCCTQLCGLHLHWICPEKKSSWRRRRRLWQASAGARRVKAVGLI